MPLDELVYMLKNMPSKEELLKMSVAQLVENIELFKMHVENIEPEKGEPGTISRHYFIR